MTDPKRWPLEFFRESDGSLPVAKWLDSLSIEVRAKVAALVEKLAEYGPTLDFPYSSQIEGRLRELRMRIGKSRYRILYCFDNRRVAVLLHGFVKNTAQIPDRDKQVGMLRMEAHFHRTAKRGDK